jgi:VanZ family protein
MKVVHPFLVGFWLILIFFSSTNMAWQLADSVYLAVFGAFHFSQNTESLFLAQKSVHVCLFAGLGFLLWTSIPGKTLQKLILISLACFITGSLSEGFQYFFPGRHPDWRDVLLNGLSGTVAVSFLAVRVVIRLRKLA